LVFIVNGGSHNSQFFSNTKSRRLLWSALVAGASLLTTAAQQPAAQHSAGATIEGHIFDSAGGLVSGTAVRLEKQGTPNPFETHSDAAGAYVFSALPSGSYMLTAEKSGSRTPAPAALTLSQGDRKQIDLVLINAGNASSVAQPMGFSDTPNFTVAGITDWTAVGGHGSDSILRTSEDLARETLALKPQGAGDNSGRSASAINSEQS
jgi:hypothetical protein